MYDSRVTHSILSFLLLGILVIGKLSPQSYSSLLQLFNCNFEELIVYIITALQHNRLYTKIEIVTVL